MTQRPDIIFAAANVLGSMDEKNLCFRPFEQEFIIDPDSMFHEIESAVQ